MSVITKATQRVITMVTRHERLRTIAYDDATGKPPLPGRPLQGKLTIGYGHTGSDVFRGQVIDEAKAREWLAADISKAERTVVRYVTAPLNQNQFDALVDFVFNVGSGQFAGSTLLRELNSGHYKNASLEFGKWIYRTVGGKKEKSTELIGRREEERQLFCTES